MEKEKIQKIWQNIKDYIQFTIFGLIIYSALFVWIWYLISLGLDIVFG